LTDWPGASISEPVYPFDIKFEFNEPDRNLALKNAGKYTLTALLYLQTNRDKFTIRYDGQVTLPKDPKVEKIVTFTRDDVDNPSITVTDANVFRQLSNVIILFTKPDGEGTQTICKTLKYVLPDTMKGIEIDECSMCV
jgi:hypothetical protein